MKGRLLPGAQRPGPRRACSGNDVDRRSDRDDVQPELIFLVQTDAAIGDLRAGRADPRVGGGCDWSVDRGDGVAETLPALDRLGMPGRIEHDRPVSRWAGLLG